MHIIIYNFYYNILHYDIYVCVYIFDIVFACVCIFNIFNIKYIYIRITNTHIIVKYIYYNI